MSRDSYRVLRTLEVEGQRYRYFSLPALAECGLNVARLPYSLKILLESLLRREDGVGVPREDIAALANWDPAAEPDREIAFMPARVLLQDFTGVPAVVDLAAMREAMAKLGGDPQKINPLLSAELVIDHSVQVDAFGRAGAFEENQRREYERNAERYAFLRWGQKAFQNFRVVPPDTGIVHQVNLEFLARVVCEDPAPRIGASGYGTPLLYPDTVVGTDSHTTMINGLGVLGWGVGGIEAEAAMLGQPIPLLIPQVVGVKLTGKLPAAATATDMVLTATQMLRKLGVVGKFVEFHGPGLAGLTLADRATLANMAPEYGATCGIVPVDAETIAYLRLTGRDEAQVKLVEAYARAQGLFGGEGASEVRYSQTLELDLAAIQPSLAGPRRPHDRVELRKVAAAFDQELDGLLKTGGGQRGASAGAKLDGGTVELGHGSVVIAAITSCTNTSNPAVMLAAGLLAKKAAQRGLKPKPWVKTSLAPGSQVVTAYLRAAGLLAPLESLGFHVVGYGCTTCIGNSGPLPEPVRAAVTANKLVVAAVLSGNRNFEGRISPEVRANYLASPPLVVAYALLGRIDQDLNTTPLGRDAQGCEVRLADIWPTGDELKQALAAVTPKMFRDTYARVFEGSQAWQALPAGGGDRFAWQADSTYIRHPDYFEGMSRMPGPLTDIRGARVLAWLGDSVTTDHISPAGDIAEQGPAGDYLRARGVQKPDFNSYGARRGNHEVMVRGTFANVRLKNLLVPGVEGGVTRHLPGGERLSIFDAAERYRASGVPLLILAGQEYGSGSSRDWAAKGTAMLGVRAVIARSYERIHRSNLIGMGVLPLQFQDAQDAAALGLTGEEQYAISGIAALEPRGTVTILARAASGQERDFEARVRIDTPVELEYYRHGGILRYVLRQLLG